MQELPKDIQELLGVKEGDFRDQIVFSVKGFGTSEAVYILQPLTCRENQEVYHDSLYKVINAVGQLFNGDEQEGPSVADFARAVTSIDKKTLFELGDKLLCNATIVSDGEKHNLGNPATSNYYRGREDEYYIAVGYAIKENYPKVFFTLKDKFGGFLDKFIKKLKSGSTQVFQNALSMMEPSSSTE